MQKDVKLGITKEKLIDATFALMEELDDPLNVTSRQIADRAGVKPSMINYCFGSRESLMYQTFQKQYMSFLKDKDVEKLVASDLPPKELLKKLHCLEEPYREVTYLRAFGGLSFAEIGEVLGKTENWARVTFFRAKEILKKTIEGSAEI